MKTRERFTARTHRAEGQLLAFADRSANRIDDAIQDLWTDLLALIESKPPTILLHKRATAILARLPMAVIGSLSQVLGESATRAHGWVQTSTPRLIALVEDDLPEMMLGFSDETIFPAISQSEVHRIVYSTGWQARLETLTRLANPSVLATQLVQAISSGATPRQAAAIIRPAVQGVQTSARRIARHESVRVAHEARFAAYESLGTDLVIGYQIHAVLDSRTRPEHRKRDGQRYYREPSGRQIGFDRMPRPPMEADGSVAFNCRCYLTPILAE